MRCGQRVNIVSGPDFRPLTKVTGVPRESGMSAWSY